MSLFQYLCEGVVTKWNATAALTALVPTARLYFSLASRGATYPLVVFHNISGHPQYTFGAVNHIEYIIQFSVFDDSLAADTAQQIAREISSAYKLATLTIASGAAQLAGALWFNDERSFRDGELWHHSLDFDVRLRAA